MRYNKIRKIDISNGPGIRVSVFFQGCNFHCKNCFTPETWSFDSGEEFTDETINHILDLCSEEHISGLSLLGGEKKLHDEVEEGKGKVKEVGSETDLLGFCSDFALPLSRL